MPKKIEMTEEEWNILGEQLFGNDRMKWRFVCPTCGHIASVADWKDAGAPEGAVAISCIGRWKGAIREAFGKGRGPCNYAGRGLFQLNPVYIGTQSIFDFDRTGQTAVDESKNDAV